MHVFSEFDMYIFMYGYLYLQKKQKQRHIPGHSQPHPQPSTEVSDATGLLDIKEVHLSFQRHSPVSSIEFRG